MKTMRTMRTMKTNCQEDFYSLFEFNQLEQAAIFHAPASITSRPSSRLAENPTQQAPARSRKHPQRIARRSRNNSLAPSYHSFTRESVVNAQKNSWLLRTQISSVSLWKNATPHTGRRRIRGRLCRTRSPDRELRASVPRRRAHGQTLLGSGCSRVSPGCRA